MKHKKILIIIFGFIFWPISLATPQIVTAKLFGYDLEKYLAIGIGSGLVGAVLFLGFSWLIAKIIKLINKSSTITTHVIFFILTCLMVILWLNYVVKYSSVLFS